MTLEKEKNRVKIILSKQYMEGKATVVRQTTSFSNYALSGSWLCISKKNTEEYKTVLRKERHEAMLV